MPTSSRTWAAAAYMALPACSAASEHMPAARMVTVAPCTTQTDELRLVNTTGFPEAPP